MNASTSSDPVVLSAARWFWWIAGLSLVNSVLHYAGSNTSFVIGLAMTSIAAVLFSNMALALAVAGLIIGFYFLMGLFAQRGQAWAFYAGVGLYVVDALIYAKLDDWMSVAFHAYAAFWLIKGILRLRELAQSPVEQAST